MGLGIIKNRLRAKIRNSEILARRAEQHERFREAGNYRTAANAARYRLGRLK